MLLVRRQPQKYSEEPWRIGLDIALDGEELRLTADGEMTVLDATRT